MNDDYNIKKKIMLRRVFVGIKRVYLLSMLLSRNLICLDIKLVKFVRYYVFL